MQSMLGAWRYKVQNQGWSKGSVLVHGGGVEGERGHAVAGSSRLASGMHLKAQLSNQHKQGSGKSCYLARKTSQMHIKTKMLNHYPFSPLSKKIRKKGRDMSQRQGKMEGCRIQKHSCPAQSLPPSRTRVNCCILYPSSSRQMVRL